MARARNIKPGFYKNEDLAECSILARFIFPGLWMLADREGRLEDRPKRIKGELLPYDGEEVDSLLNELSQRGFIVRYEVDGQRFIQISKFTQHQTPHVREQASTIPALPDTNQSTTLVGARHYLGSAMSSPRSPDSLNPSLLNPSLLNPETREPTKPSPQKSGDMTFPEYLNYCKQNSVKPIPEDDSIFEWAEKIKLPIEYLHIAWLEFKRREWLDKKGKPKKYKNWRQVFRKYCEAGWLDIWQINSEGEFYLTVKGKQLEKSNAQ